MKKILTALTLLFSVFAGAGTAQASELVHVVSGKLGDPGTVLHVRDPYIKESICAFHLNLEETTFDCSRLAGAVEGPGKFVVQMSNGDLDNLDRSRMIFDGKLYNPKGESADLGMAKLHVERHVQVTKFHVIITYWAYTSGPSSRDYNDFGISVVAIPRQ